MKYAGFLLFENTSDAADREPTKSQSDYKTAFDEHPKSEMYASSEAF